MKVSRDRDVEPHDTSVVISVSIQSERDLKSGVEYSNVGWLGVDKQHIDISFDYGYIPQRGLLEIVNSSSSSCRQANV